MMPRHKKSCASRRGSILILAMAVVIVLTSLVLVLARSMRVEASGSANFVAQVQAESTARGAIEYVRAMLDGANGLLPYDEDLAREAVPVGQGYFWLLKHDPDDTTGSYRFGINDEAGKLNINTADRDALARLLSYFPSNASPDDMAASIVDWRTGGTLNTYYNMLPTPYQAKIGNFETVDELLLVKDITPDVLYGNDTNRNGVLDAGDATAGTSMLGRDLSSNRGFADCVTVYSVEPMLNLAGKPQMKIGLVNVNTAPVAVLASLPRMTEDDAHAIVAHRQGAGDLTSVADLLDVLAQDKAVAIADLVTTRSFRCSADIVATDLTGRAFKRYQVVFDAQTSPPTVLYCRDLTSLGWPLDKQILDNLRAGQPPTVGGSSGLNSSNTAGLGGGSSLLKN